MFKISGDVGTSLGRLFTSARNAMKDLRLYCAGHDVSATVQIYAPDGGFHSTKEIERPTPV